MFSYFKLKRPAAVQDIHKATERPSAFTGPSYQLQFIQYKAGDFVQERIGKGKFTSTCNGPYEVTKKLSDLTYQIRMKNEDGKRQYKIVHHNKLKPYY